MVSNIIFHPEAAEELDQAIIWYEEQQADLGRFFFDEYLALRDEIVANPQHFAFTFEDIRRANFHRFPYFIVFSVEEDALFIYGIMHQKRNPKAWQERVK